MLRTLAELRRFAVSRSLRQHRTLGNALERAGFVQADPIRAPARAQDLTLRPRVRGYRAGDLEKTYGSLPIEEDFFINYGFVTRRVQALMHPRSSVTPTASNKKARAILDFIRERGTQDDDSQPVRKQGAGISENTVGPDFAIWLDWWKGFPWYSWTWIERLRRWKSIPG